MENMQPIFMMQYEIFAVAGYLSKNINGEFGIGKSGIDRLVAAAS